MSDGKVEIRMLRTGVPGLDEVMGKGIPGFSFNLIAGSARCGKTTLARIKLCSPVPETGRAARRIII